jgi:hypothetical protein
LSDSEENAKYYQEEYKRTPSSRMGKVEEREEERDKKGSEDCIAQ